MCIRDRLIPSSVAYHFSMHIVEIAFATSRVCNFETKSTKQLKLTHPCSTSSAPSKTGNKSGMASTHIYMTKHRIFTHIRRASPWHRLRATKFKGKYLWCIMQHRPTNDMMHLQCKAAYRVDHRDCMLVYDSEGRDCSVTCLDWTDYLLLGDMTEALTTILCDTFAIFVWCTGD